ncbi:hypothetical protein ASE17_19055 [Phenylobacterium sp. Root77]|nr:hypothetical protein ASC73_20465 [Phenylobacterium sp. Root1277]KQW94239.1 hypothetical protein ASC79_00325 [Phenylobacterium sp. Root1290]KRC38959.1 hypothetical protein ASE17_19055 [Phenylobacterium sp. Root77]
MRRPALTGAILLSLAAPASAQIASPAVEPETIPAQPTLPKVYPQSWVFVHDLNGTSVIDGRVAVVDVGAGEPNLKGHIRAAQFAAMVQGMGVPDVRARRRLGAPGRSGPRRRLLRRYDGAQLPVSFKPYTAAEIAAGRRAPLRADAARVRRELIAHLGAHP